MEFNSNSAFLYIIAAAVIVFVLAQSLFFLIRACKRAKELGLTAKTIRKTIMGTAVFTIAPAISFLLGIVTLSKFLGIPLPWVRMSVIGAITYEIPAATAAASSFGIKELSEMITDPEVYSAIAWVMTLGIMPSIILPPFLMKKIRSGVVNLQNKDSKWGELFLTSLFLGMISAFLGLVFTDVRKGLEGFIPIFVLLFSAAVMAICGILIKKFKIKWLETYAMSLSLVLGMIFAIVITPIIK